MQILILGSQVRRPKRNMLGLGSRRDQVGLWKSWILTGCVLMMLRFCCWCVHQDTKVCLDGKKYSCSLMAGPEGVIDCDPHTRPCGD